MSRRLRDRIDELLRTDADLDAFCIDEFPKVAIRFTQGLDRVAKVNLLLTLESPAHVRSRLERQAVPAWRLSGRWSIPALLLIPTVLLGFDLARSRWRALSPSAADNAGHAPASTTSDASPGSDLPRLVRDPEHVEHPPQRSAPPESRPRRGPRTSTASLPTSGAPSAGATLIRVRVVAPAGSWIAFAGQRRPSVRHADEFGVTDAARATFEVALVPGVYSLSCSMPDREDSVLGQASLRIKAEETDYVSNCPP